MTQDRDVLVARVHRGIDAQASIPTGKAKPALASQEPALTSRNGFPGGRGKFTPKYSRTTIFNYTNMLVYDYSSSSFADIWFWNNVTLIYSIFR